MTKRRQGKREGNRRDGPAANDAEVPRRAAPPQKRPWMLLTSACLFVAWLIILIWLALDASRGGGQDLPPVADESPPGLIPTLTE